MKRPFDRWSIVIAAIAIAAGVRAESWAIPVPSFRVSVDAPLIRVPSQQLLLDVTTLATTIRDRQQLDRQIKTLTAEGRISAYVLTALPLLVGAAMALLNPDYFEPLRTSPGSLILFGAVALLGVGWIWMRSMIKAEI